MLFDNLGLDRRLIAGRGGLYRFVRLGWSQIESSPFVEGWHLEEVCAHLEAVSCGDCRRLVINVPPGTGKSLLVSVFWPVWDWIFTPTRKWMFASFDISLSQRDALRSKELIESRWFQERWGKAAPAEELKALGIKPLTIYGDARQNTASIYWTFEGGLRFSTSVGGKSTGWHADFQIVDDPTKPSEILSGGIAAQNALRRAKEWYSGAMSTRQANPDRFARVVVMQKLHEDDLAAQCVEEGYTHLRLPMEFEADDPCVTPYGGDRRTVEGELLAPVRFSAEIVAQLKRELGAIQAAAQLQQRPLPAGGAIFKREWFNHRWSALPLRERGVFVISVDCAFKDAATSSYVVLQKWYFTPAVFYLVDERRDHMDFSTTLQAVIDFSRTERNPVVLIEDKANGPAIISILKKRMPRVIEWKPQGKEAQANAVSSYFEAGNVRLPEDAPWTDDYVQELISFPRGRYNDRVDATAQAVLWYTQGEGRSRTRMRDAMKRVAADR